MRMLAGTYWDPVSSSEKEYPNVRVRCDDGWTIIDYKLDKEVEKYFSSFGICTEYVASSALADRVSFTEWWLPYAEGDAFYVAEDCKECKDGGEGTMST